LINDNLDIMQVFNVREFVDRDRGSVRIDVVDGQAGANTTKTVSFYRLKQTKETSELVAYDSDTSRCSEENTSTWILGDFSRALENLFATNEAVLKTKSIQDDPSLVGQSALLQLVYNNADKFTLDSKGFDNIYLANVYYFSTGAFDFGLEDEAKLVAVVETDHINVNALNDRDDIQALERKLKMGTTTLADAAIRGHITSVGLLTDTKRHTGSDYLRKKSNLLMDFAALRPPRLLVYVSYQLIQARVQSRHVGVTGENPFLLPAGVGCGIPASKHRPLSVYARQFSGHFSAEDDPNDYFVAYDETSNHLRHDTLGAHKVIYALTDRLVTLIGLERGDGHPPDAADRSASNTSAADGADQHQHHAEAIGQNRVHENALHCAQTRLYATGETWQNQVNVNSMGDLLGMGGSRIGLMYLGYDYSLNCHVYEREIDRTDIPLLVRMHVRLEPGPRGKLALVFYFVNELESLTGSNLFGRKAHDYESMWLKRIELIATVDVSKYTLLNARLTFTRSSWSLGTVSNIGHERQSELLHPTRTFDTLECWPARAQTQLDLVLERMATIGHEQKRDAASQQEETADDGRPIQLTEALEESMMHFVVEQIGFPRSEVCDFELIVPLDRRPPMTGHNSSAALSGGDDNNQDRDEDERRSPLPSTMLLRMKLVKPLDYTFERYLVGWVKSIVPVLSVLHRARMVRHKYLMSVHECMLELAVRLGSLHDSKPIHMLYCPRDGCAHLLGDKPLEDHPAIDFVPVSAPSAGTSAKLSAQSYPDMCEIYLVKRRVNTDALQDERSRPEILQAKLTRSKMLLEAYELTEGSEFASTLHQAIVSRVTLSSALDLNLIDEQVFDGVCYTLYTRLASKSDGDRANSGGPTPDDAIKIVELQFDKHHARAHCHKACMMYEFCQTYSYSAPRRTCHLSSITKRQLASPDTLLLDDGDSAAPPKDCTIHALNHVSLYRRSAMVMYDSPKELLNLLEKKLFTCSLDDCANLCHLNELPKSHGQPPPTGTDGDVTWGCRYFRYMRMEAICIVPQDVDVPAGLAAPANLIDNDDSRRPNELYKRDCLHEYALERGAGLRLSQPAAATEAGDGGGGRPMHELPRREAPNELECSLVCSVLEASCVAFDWCPMLGGRVNMHPCRLYRFRSPFTLPRGAFEATADRQANGATGKLPAESPLASQLTDLEASFYVAGRSSEHEVSIEPEKACHHYYLDADSLYLKRALASAKTNYRHQSDDANDAVDAELSQATSGGDARVPADDTPDSSSSPERCTDHLRPTGVSSLVWLLVRMLSATAIGSGVFLLQPAIVQLLAKVRLFETLRRTGLPGWVPAKRRDRSMSRVEITEMMDFDE
jgi:hypothetical protein